MLRQAENGPKHFRRSTCPSWRIASASSGSSTPRKSWLSSTLACALVWRMAAKTRARYYPSVYITHFMFYILTYSSGAAPCDVAEARNALPQRVDVRVLHNTFHRLRLIHHLYGHLTGWQRWTIDDQERESPVGRWHRVGRHRVRSSQTAWSLHARQQLHWLDIPNRQVINHRLSRISSKVRIVPHGVHLRDGSSPVVAFVHIVLFHFIYQNNEIEGKKKKEEIYENRKSTKNINKKELRLQPELHSSSEFINQY